MRLSAVAAVIGYTSFALAQAQLLPQCAKSCVDTDIGGCGTLDVECICNNRQLIKDLACCVSKGCNADDQQTVINFAQNLCRPQGVTDIPSSATCASGASSATGSSSSAASTAASASAASSAASAAATGGAGTCQGNTAGMGFGLVLAGLLGAL